MLLCPRSLESVEDTRSPHIQLPSSNGNVEMRCRFCFVFSKSVMPQVGQSASWTTPRIFICRYHCTDVSSSFIYHNLFFSNLYNVFINYLQALINFSVSYYIINTRTFAHSLQSIDTTNWVPPTILIHSEDGESIHPHIRVFYLYMSLCLFMKPFTIFSPLSCHQ